MEWLTEFGGWFGLVALAFGGPALVQHHFSQSGASRRRILRSAAAREARSVQISLNVPRCC